MQLTEADALAHQQICNAPHWPRVARLGVAVSGGGDSMALLHLLKLCADARGVALRAATVDHGLRAAAAEEAAFVAETCQSLDIPHETLHWRGWDGLGNLQAEARAARYRLLGGWAARHRLDTVALGHTQDDQAETLLMRLAREAGVDGLAAMESVFARDGTRFWRPMLALTRAELRGFLTRHGLGWREDPSNEDDGFDRVKARRALDALAPLGIDRATLQGVARNLAAASAALKRYSRETADRIARIEGGDVVFAAPGLLATDAEIRRRLLAQALVWISSAAYAPRREALAQLERAIDACKPHTLHGCLVTRDRATVRITREFNAVKDLQTTIDRMWDSRWRITGPGEGLTIRALGAALKHCPGWRETGLPRPALMASPAVWQGERLIAAPGAGMANGFSAVIDAPGGDFFTSILSH
ncbi:MAG: tRNA lysidine(34) synthetase TilS [Rhodobacterales bacterium CG2_30_65_12]|nr:MAG: tRNA lysidine(34) synthetase TilS [Rhodobacterales bacterium CG2_30_65_12]